MAQPVIVFVQRGHSPILGYSIKQAQAAGCRAILLGDDDARSACSSESYDLQIFWKGAELFSRIYKHTSVNEKSYELFCFQRWFAVKELQDSLQCPVIYADSDLLVYQGIGHLQSYLEGRKFLNTSWLNCFTKPCALEFLLEYFQHLFSKESLQMDVARKYAFGEHLHISDMTLFYELGDLFGGKVVDFRRFGAYLGFDDCIRDFRGYAQCNHHKDIRFVEDVPYCSRDIGGVTRFFTLHFQGISKPLMQLHHTITQADGLASLEDLSFWFDVPGHSENGGFKETRARYYELQRMRRKD